MMSLSIRDMMMSAIYFQMVQQGKKKKEIQTYKEKSSGTKYYR